jgi:protein TonB
MGEIVDLTPFLARNGPAAPKRAQPRDRPRRRAIAVAGSILVHVAVAIVLMLPTTPPFLVTGLAQRAGEGGGGAINVTLVRAPGLSVNRAAPQPPKLDTRNPTLGPPQPTPVARMNPPAVRTPPSSPSAASLGGQPKTSPSANPGDAAQTVIGLDFRRRVLDQIERNKRYPRVMGADRPRGVVRVLFTLSRSGTVLGAWVQVSSGSEAVATLLRSQPLPNIPPELPDRMNLTFDMDYSPGLGASAD